MSTLKLYEQVADELAEAIRKGRRAGGSALPTLRAFARERRIGLSTATRTYAELQRRGLIVGEVGRGTFVRERPIGSGSVSPAARYTTIGRGAESVGAATLRSSLRVIAGLPDLERLTAQSSPLGSPAARRALSVHLARSASKASPARIAIVGGGLAALRLAALVALCRGQCIATDAVTYPGWKLVGEQLGLRLAPVMFDDDGPLPGSLGQLLRRRRVTALHCMPTAHHPLGWVMSLQRRRDIVALARAHDLLLIEDLTYNHLVVDAPPTLAELAPERTWVVGSLSGVLGDGFRLGFVVAPKPQEAALEKTALLWGLAAPPLLAELARHWLEDGTVESLQEAQREQARALWKAMADTGLQMQGPSTHGWWRWLPVRRGYRCEEVVSELRHQGIDVLSSEAFAVTPTRPNAIAVRLRLLAPAQCAALVPALLAAST